MLNSPLPSLHPEKWLAERFVRVAESDPHFESSWYGLHIALLPHYFPYQQKFLIKPQPKVRDPFEEELSFCSNQAETSMSSDLDDNFAGDTSMTSIGVLTLPGSTYLIPDFTVTKATKFTTHDKLLLLLEVKSQEPEDMKDWTSFATQMEKYMDAASQHLEKDASLVGLLICGTVVQVCKLASPGAEIVTDRRRCDMNSVAVRRLLHNLAKGNWD